MAATPESVKHTQTLNFDFKVPGRELAHVKVTVRPNDDPKAIGYHLVFPDKPIEYSLGYPACTAKVTSLKSTGYAAYYGWTQMVGEPSDFYMDPLPITADLNMPFAFFGAEPQLFDCPSRSGDVRNLDWIAVSFLTYVEDAGLSKHLRPILAFEWGFWIVDGEVRVKPLKARDAGEAWEQQRGLLESKHAGWTFGKLDEKIEVKVHASEGQ